jgi:hypothetical protein
MPPHEPQPYEQGDVAYDVESLAAALRRDAADLEVYARVLTGSLAGALPAGAVTVDRRRGMADRLAGRAGTVERLDVSLGEHRLVLHLAHGRPAAEICTQVRGVVLARRPVELDEWLRVLAQGIAERARSDARAKAALERLLLGE